MYIKQIDLSVLPIAVAKPIAAAKPFEPLRTKDGYLVIRGARRRRRCIG